VLNWNRLTGWNARTAALTGAPQRDSYPAAEYGVRSLKACDALGYAVAHAYKTQGLNPP
jgi:glucose-6-phosphate dehydrogenase assembly protein OpcA